MITEAKGDDDLLDQLRIKYGEFNSLYFNSRLPRIPMRWGNLKNQTAMVTMKVVAPRSNPKRRSLVSGSLAMVFSTKYVRTLEEWIPILLHEMIHVYIAAILENVEEHHGDLFMSELKKLEAKSQITIPLTDRETKTLELSEPEKEIAVLVRRINHDRLAFALFTPKFIEQNIDTVIARYTREHCEVRLVKSALWTRKAANLPMQRNIGFKTKFWIMNDEARDDLMRNSRVLWTNALNEARLYHGTPASFDQFDLAFVGTGQSGTGSHGWGIYLSDSPKIADSYRGQGGTLCHVDLSDTSTLLNWDAGFAEQTGAVHEALARMDYPRIFDHAKERLRFSADMSWEKQTGQDIYDTLRSIIPYRTEEHTDEAYRTLQKRVSVWLLRNGIHGLFYSSFLNSTNYVIFDPSLITIVSAKK